MTSEARHNLFLALKEALNNVVKHSRATEVNIGISVRETGIELVVKDNGCGFSTGASNRMVPGNGLGNMRQRLEKIGGRCDIVSAPGEGTTVRFTFSANPPSP